MWQHWLGSPFNSLPLHTPVFSIFLTVTPSADLSKTVTETGQSGTNTETTRPCSLRSAPNLLKSDGSAL